jgi:hypothetical protein
MCAPLVIYKFAQRKQSTQRRNFAQSGHPSHQKCRKKSIQYSASNGTYAWAQLGAFQYLGIQVLLLKGYLCIHVYIMCT